MVNMNKLHNLSNPYQGKAHKVLCVCSAGLLRSPTAAVVLQREFGFNTRAAGCQPEYALIDATHELCLWADEIVVMESWMRNTPVIGDYSDKVACLDIPDKYPYMAEELQKLIKEAYKSL